MVHYYCPFLQCQEISESVHLIDFVQTSVVCTLLTIIFTDASVLEESKQKMTDSNQVRILYLNLVLVSTSAELVKPLYCTSSRQTVAGRSGTSTVPSSIGTYLYCSTWYALVHTCFCIPQPILVRTSTR